MASTSNPPLGLTWSDLPVPTRRSSVERVTARYRQGLAEFVWDAAVLENNPFTFVEVQTLLDGVTVGGHKLSDQQQIVRLAASNKELDQLVRSSRFRLDKATSDRLHKIIATDEALEAGHFRGEGEVGGPDSRVSVSLGERGRYEAPAAGDDGAILRRIHAEGLVAIGELDDPFHRGLVYFAFGALQQFYFDGNKRTARHMMNGTLMSAGYDAISIPAARKLEFNTTMVDFYTSRDATDLLDFLASCSPK